MGPVIFFKKETKFLFDIFFQNIKKNSPSNVCMQ